VTHDAFVAAWRGWATVRDEDRRDAWFGRILVNRCRDTMRRQRRRPVVDISDAIGTLSTGRDVASDAIDRDAVARAFARLRPDQRIVVVLRYYGDLTVPQIATQTGLPVGTVKSRLHASLQAMRVTIDPRPGEDQR
jgi:RNA polymerase sigma-70 factor (ECF subfamily)